MYRYNMQIQRNERIECTLVSRCSHERIECTLVSRAPGNAQIQQIQRNEASKVSSLLARGFESFVVLQEMLMLVNAIKNRGHHWLRDNSYIDLINGFASHLLHSRATVSAVRFAIA